MIDILPFYEMTFYCKMTTYTLSRQRALPSPYMANYLNFENMCEIELYPVSRRNRQSAYS